MRWLVVILLMVHGLVSAQDPLREAALATLQEVSSSGNFVDVLPQGSAAVMPFGLRKSVGASDLIIAIDSAYFTPNGAFFNAYFSLQLPQAEQPIVFGARHIRFNPSGVIGGSQSRLLLLSEHAVDLSPRMRLRLPADGSNFVSWDCSGFTGVDLSGIIEIRSDLLVPVDSSQEHVNARLAVHTSDPADLLCMVDLSPFRISGMSDWSFDADQIVFDWSDKRDPAFLNSSLPTGLWRGFFIQRMNITAPDYLKNNEEPFQFQVQNFLIDEQGLSGSFAASMNSSTNLAGLELHLEELHCSFYQNQLTGAGFGGVIQFPEHFSNGIRCDALITKDPNALESSVHLAASTTEPVNWSLFNASLNFLPQSSLQLHRVNGNWKTLLDLYGDLSISNSTLEGSQLQFRHLVLQTEEPFIREGQFILSASSSSRAGGYPLSLTEVLLHQQPEGPALLIRGGINFMDQQTGGLSAEARVMVRTQRSSGGKPRYWKTDIQQIAVNVQTQPFHLQGQLSFFDNDPVYGKGFFGGLQFSLPDVMDQPVSANTGFGNNGFRYFYADVFVPADLPLGTLPVKLDGISGGLYYHMRPQRNDLNSLAASVLLLQQPQSGAAQRYFPDLSMGLGFKAGVAFSNAVSEKAFNGDLMLEVNFQSSGALNSISFNGALASMATHQERRNGRSPVLGNAAILYHHLDETLDAQFTMSFNAANGISGSGTSIFHYDPQDWWLRIGRPLQPINVSLYGLASAQSYLMTGTQAEPMAPPPYQVASLVQNAGMGLNRNAALLSQGNGFCAGARLSAGYYKEVGWNDFTIYSSFSIGAGTDLMAGEVPAGYVCSSNGQTPGWNRWIMQGQLYAWLYGVVGVEGRALGQNFDIRFIEGTVVTLISGKAPNPSWINGQVAGSFTILGVIHGSVNLNVELGSNCNLIQG